MRPAKKDPMIRDFQSKIMGVDVVKAINLDMCVVCRKEVRGFSSAIAAKEFTISGMCEPCQDEVFGFLEDLAEEADGLEMEDVD